MDARPSGAPEIPEVLREDYRPPMPAKARKYGPIPTLRSATSPEMKAIAVGVELIAMGLAGVLIGLGIDALAGTGRLWTIIMGCVGFVCGIYQTIKDALALNREMTELEQRRKSGRGPRRESRTERE